MNAIAAYDTYASQASSATVGQGRWRRLPKEGVAVLEHFYNNVSTHPSEAERVELAEAVRRIPRCDFYTPQKVYNWFLNSRTRAKRAGPAGTIPSGGVVAKLDVLLGEVPNPSLEVAEIWAECLGTGTSAQDIVSYAHARRSLARGDAATAAVKEAGGSATPAQSQRAPTPTPTPSPKLEPARLDLVSSDSGSQPPSPIFDGGTGTPTEDSRTSVPPEDADQELGAAAAVPEVGELARRLAGVLSHETPPDPEAVPHSLAGLAEWLGGETAASAALLERISSGVYAHLGLVLPRPPGAAVNE